MLYITCWRFQEKFKTVLPNLKLSPFCLGNSLIFLVRKTWKTKFFRESSVKLVATCTVNKIVICFSLELTVSEKFFEY